MARDDDYEDDDRPRRPKSGSGAASGLSIAFIIIAVVGVVGLCVVGGLIALLLPAVQKVRQAADRMKSSNNLKQIALALHSYHDTYQQFPPPYTTTKDGQPGVSWRVLILPFLEQDALYRQFRVDEPWDSPNNLPLSNVTIPTYIHPNDAPNNLTRYRIFVGGGAPFEPGKKTKLFGANGPNEIDFADGTANTLMVVEAADLVPWAKPDELTYDPRGPLPRLGAPAFGGDFQAALGDGSVRTFRRDTPEATLRSLITSRGGEPLPPDF